MGRRKRGPMPKKVRAIVVERSDGMCEAGCGRPANEVQLGTKTPDKKPKTRYNRSGPKPSAGNTRRGLTRSLDSARKGLVMNATRKVNLRRNARKPERVRFAISTVEGPPPEFNPSLGPCLLWTGSIKPNGYGQMRWHGENGYVHRYAWTVANGSIPGKLTVDHLCRVRHCVRVEHLELCSNEENSRRGGRDRERCQNGHLRSEVPYVIDTKGNRRCTLCLKNLRVRNKAKFEATYQRRGPAKPRFGEDNPSAVLTNAEAIAIYGGAISGRTLTSLAKEYGVGISTVARIKNRQSWVSVISEVYPNG